MFLFFYLNLFDRRDVKVDVIDAVETAAVVVAQYAGQVDAAAAVVGGVADLAG